MTSCRSVVVCRGEVGAIVWIVQLIPGISGTFSINL